MDTNTKNLKLCKNILLTYTESNTPIGIKMNRDLTVKEACYCFRNILYFDIDLAINEFETDFERKDYRNNITYALNEYIKGHADLSHLCTETFCYDFDGEGISPVCLLRLIEYLMKKDII